MSVLDATVGFIESLRAGVWRPVDEARAQLAIELAGTLDKGAGLAVAAVARELRATLSELAVTDDPKRDAWAEFEASLGAAE